MKFTKMHGIGNDFVMVDCLEAPLEGDLAVISQKVCSRHFGVGADGLILVEKGVKPPFRMRMFNPDGSESEMCGNGIRCFAQFLRDKGVAPPSYFDVETAAGIIRVMSLESGWSINMGRPSFSPDVIGMSGYEGAQFFDQPINDYLGTAISMGNPHLVIFVPDVAAVDLNIEGPRLEHHPYFPNRINVHFAHVEPDGSIRMRTWERGAGATLACGTGACAVAVVAYFTGRGGKEYLIHLPGGDLEVEYWQHDATVQMTGTAVAVFEGEFAI